MIAVRAFLAMVVVGFGGAWLLNAPTTAPPSTAPVRARMAATTSTTAAPPPTTTTTAARIDAAPRIRAQRASRGATRPVVAPNPQIAADGAGDCGMWGYKSRARSDECWGPAVAAYGDWSTSTMLRIMYCESHGNPWVVNASNHVGLFQIKDSNTKGDGPGNIAHAHAMWLRSGTAPWRQCGG